MASRKSHRPKTGPARPGVGTSRSPGGSKSRSARVKSPGKSADPKSRYDRYLALARDAAASGDAVESENYLQHADHYFRLLNEKTA